MANPTMDYDYDYDLVIVGGGIHGAGVAQAAAAAGYKALVVEKDKLASGTSSRSSKLIHGGLRYLESGEFSLVRECLQERDRLLTLAPDLVQLKPFYVPIYKNTRRRPWQLYIGLSLYWLLSGCSYTGRFRKLPQSEWQQLDGLKTTDLECVFEYWDGQTDDATLTRAVMQSALSLGAELHMPAQFLGARLDDQGCEVEYSYNNEQINCTARVLVNAAGPWAGQVLEQISPAPHKQAFCDVELVQGTHLLLPGALKKGMYYLEAPQDQRAIFIMQRGENILLGTTEKGYAGDPDNVCPSVEEVDYLLDVLRHYFPDHLATTSDKILSSYAGLRVLPGGNDSPFSRAREIILAVDRDQQPRLLTIYGGKLTSYRIDAEKVINKLATSLPNQKPVADTRVLPLALP